MGTSSQFHDSAQLKFYCFTHTPAQRYYTSEMDKRNLCQDLGAPF